MAIAPAGYSDVGIVSTLVVEIGAGVSIKAVAVGSVVSVGMMVLVGSGVSVD